MISFLVHVLLAEIPVDLAGGFALSCLHIRDNAREQRRLTARLAALRTQHQCALEQLQGPERDAQIARLRGVDPDGGWH